MKQFYILITIVLHSIAYLSASNNSQTELVEPKQHASAKKIQAVFRDYQVRQQQSSIRENFNKISYEDNHINHVYLIDNSYLDYNDPNFEMKKKLYFDNLIPNNQKEFLKRYDRHPNALKDGGVYLTIAEAEEYREKLENIANLPAHTLTSEIKKRQALVLAMKNEIDNGVDMFNSGIQNNAIKHLKKSCDFKNYVEYKAYNKAFHRGEYTSENLVAQIKNKSHKCCTIS
jgi:hypothetical protein